jgi:hypothetical protein
VIAIFPAHARETAAEKTHLQQLMIATSISVARVLTHVDTYGSRAIL